jgi:protein-disulfide isomerase
VVAANPAGTTTLVEFYDLNCPFCRIASADIADMVAVDPQLRLVLVPFPVLGERGSAQTYRTERSLCLCSMGVVGPAAGL